MKRLIKKAGQHKLEFDILFGYTTEFEAPKKWDTLNNMLKEISSNVSNQDAMDYELDLKDQIESDLRDALASYNFREVGFKEDYPESGENISSVITENRADIPKFTLEYVLKDDSQDDKARKDLIDDLSFRFGIKGHNDPDSYITSFDNMYISFILVEK